MIDFESYVKSNWKDVIADAVSCGIKYSHSSREAKDKKSDATIINNTINMTLSWFDKDNKLLRSEKLAFLNDDMTKTYDKKMLIINRKELVNKFRNAKKDIVKLIIDEKQEKIAKLNSDIINLTRYLGREDDIIPREMKGTTDISSSSASSSSTSPKQKTSFDM